MKNKKNNKEKSFFHIVPNFIIILILITFSALTFNPSLKTVLGGTTNSPIYHGDKNSNKVSLMFNVYWGTEYLNEILNVLKQNNITTTFFVGGQWVEKEPEMLRNTEQ